MKLGKYTPWGPSRAYSQDSPLLTSSRDNQINFALFHCLGPSIQTALLNAPLAVLVGWGIGKDMGLNFEIFMIVLVVLSILVVGNFLRDGKSNYLEGGLCVLVYVIIAVSTWYYPQIVPEGETQTWQVHFRWFINVSAHHEIEACILYSDIQG